MPRFFCNSADIVDKHISLHGEEAQHISRVLRMRAGDAITVSDGMGYDYSCLIEQLGDIILLRVIERYENTTESALNITLYQCLPKGDKLEFITQKAVELGCTRIVPVISRYCVSKAIQGASSFEKKRLRLERIAFEAAKQSGRGKLPVVEPLLTFEEAMKALQAEQALQVEQDPSGCGCSLFCYEGGGERIAEVLSHADTTNKNIAVFVGSEGGFSKEEAGLAMATGLIPVSLGKLILRCETAPIVAITLIRSAYGEM